MNKVICDICGTSYPESAEQCPICGYSRDFHVEPLADGEEFLLDEDLDLTEDAVKGGIFTEANVRKRNQDEQEPETEVSVDDEEEEDEDEEEDEKRRPSALLIVLLVIVILALLAVTGFIFVKYYLPGMQQAEDTMPSETATVETTAETTIPTVPCTSLAMTSDSEVTLEQLGNSWLINVVAMPADTTDEVIFMSSDLDVATVDADGTVTAVGEGSAVITVTCGEKSVVCNITCAFAEETTVPDETGTEPPTEEPTEAPEEESTEAPTEAPTEPVSNVKLKLNKTDISFDRVGVYYTLKVSDGIDPKDVEWTSGHGGVCTVKDGVITITGAGMTKVTAKYQGQEASCIVRVKLSNSTTTGGTTTGGTTTGGTTTGGTTTGGTTTGGTTTGGTTTGGTTAGGTTTGGTTTGGTTTGGTTAGDTTTGGTTTGGTTTGGTTTGGTTTGGTTTGGTTTGGTTTGGTTTGGTTTGDTTTGGTTTGGTTTGGTTTGGTTTGGTTTGGTTTGGTTTGGTTTGSTTE